MKSFQNRAAVKFRETSKVGEKFRDIKKITNDTKLAKLVSGVFISNPIRSIADV